MKSGNNLINKAEKEYGNSRTRSTPGRQSLRKILSWKKIGHDPYLSTEEDNVIIENISRIEYICI